MDYYEYTSPSYTTTSTASSEIGAVALVIMLIVILISLAVSVLMLAAMWRVFTKAGKPGWAAIIPVYNFVVLLQIVGRPEWQVLLMFLPFANIYIAIVVALDLAKSFGKTSGFGVLMIFFPAIMYPILGFGSSRYLGTAFSPQPAGYNQPPQPAPAADTQSQQPVSDAQNGQPQPPQA